MKCDLAKRWHVPITHDLYASASALPTKTYALFPWDDRTKWDTPDFIHTISYAISTFPL